MSSEDARAGDRKNLLRTVVSVGGTLRLSDHPNTINYDIKISAADSCRSDGDDAERRHCCGD